MFIAYDMVYSAMFVAGSALAALNCPSRDCPAHMIGLAIAYAVVAVVFALATRAHGNDVFDKGSALGGLRHFSEE